MSDDESLPTTVDVRAAEVGRGQRGRATRRQLRDDASIAPATIRRRLRSEAWTEPLPGVIDLGTHAPSWEGGLQELLLATGPDAWLSHATAAHLHRFLDVRRPAMADVLVRRGGATRVGTTRLHTTDAIGADEVTLVRRLRCTVPARTLLDLANGCTTDQLERFLLHLARTDRDALRQVGVLLDRYRTRPGRRRLADAVERLPSDAAQLGSPLEVLGVQALRRAGAPTPVLQYVVRDRAGAVVKRTDAAWPDLLSLAEFDGAAYHDDTSSRRADERCRSQLRALGWRVEVFRRSDLGGARLRAFAAELRTAASSS